VSFVIFVVYFSFFLFVIIRADSWFIFSVVFFRGHYSSSEKSDFFI